MKYFVILFAVFAATSAKSVTVLKSVEITDELIKNPRYLLFERDDGLIQVEDLETAENNTLLSVSNSQVVFYVYTPNNLSGTKIRANQATNIVSLTGFSLQKETVVIIHGWNNHYLSPVNVQIRKALLQKKNLNVIVVDWSSIAGGTYISSQGSVRAVGNHVGDFLITLNNALGYRLNRITLVGHSLGAHVSGNAGARTIGLVNTIVGLDPAGPLFTESNINNRLDPTDANYVHVIHTNDGLLGFGINMGHSDYYPNGGSTQPGCGIDLAGTCAHSRAYIYYAESINNNHFLSRRCDSYTNFRNSLCNLTPTGRLGYFPVARSAQSGQYYLQTNSASPFARG
ncbi:pancreatic triacylglycerol lipase-like [Euwallacea fornicatus]|uniref:pancreatic triacylglycerol lipase-like n=1 Tax=Euwallacea fornicatus TaxID=995702 RepID=UPI00338FDC12